MSPQSIVTNRVLTTVISGAFLATFCASSALAASWDSANNPQNFNQGWHPTQYDYRFNQLPLTGEVSSEHTPWADSYWPKQRGAMAYRWQEFSTPNQDQGLTEADRVRLFYNYKLYSLAELRGMTEAQINRLSPLEKLSIFNQDYRYFLVKRYHNLARATTAYWEGYCNAWSVVSLHYPEPQPVVVQNADGIRIPFGSGDVKALLTANYAEQWNIDARAAFMNLFNGGKKTAQIGNMCQYDKNSLHKFQYPAIKVKAGKEMMTDYGDTEGHPDTDLEVLVRNYQNDLKRVYATNPASLTTEQLKEMNDVSLAARARKGAQDAACMDTNAGAFHVVIGNQLGKMKEGFAFDKTRDLEVWNQPAYKYESVLKSERPGNYSIQVGNTKVRVAQVKEIETTLHYADDTDYGWTFYFPTLAKLFGAPGAAEFEREYDLYNQLLLKEGDITEPEIYPASILSTSTFHYEVEVAADGKIIGGNWLSLDRPDYLWIMKPMGFDGNFDSMNYPDSSGNYIYKPIF